MNSDPAGPDWKSADATMIFQPSSGDAVTLSPSTAAAGNEADYRRGVTTVVTGFELRPLTVISHRS